MICVSPAFVCTNVDNHNEHLEGDDDNADDHKEHPQGDDDDADDQDEYPQGDDQGNYEA